MLFKIRCVECGDESWQVGIKEAEGQCIVRGFDDACQHIHEGGDFEIVASSREPLNV